VWQKSTFLTVFNLNGHGLTTCICANWASNLSVSLLCGSCAGYCHTCTEHMCLLVVGNSNTNDNQLLAFILF
jgi:hypothetical protein